MGGGSSAQSSQGEDEEEQKRNSHAGEPSRKWKKHPDVEEAKRMYASDGTLIKLNEPGHLELRVLLDEPLAQRALGKLAKEMRSMENFMCWIDIQEFKSIPTEDYRRSKALHIYHKYIKSGAVLEIGGMTEDEREMYKEKIDQSRMDKQERESKRRARSDSENSAAVLAEGSSTPQSRAIRGHNHHESFVDEDDEEDGLKRTFYDKLQSSCFLSIYTNIFLRFKATEDFKRLTQDLKRKYNLVRIEDFEYMKKLGEGGFGLVVHCKKKSTGRHYAMKIQTKKGLLECFSDDPTRVDFEKQAFASCQHPFIVNLDYAFQTDALAIMVLGLAEGGDLQRALLCSAEERLDEKRIQYYAAEVALALNHLHSMGLIYRDLKPSNVLLCSDGHVKLVDLGGVVDINGKVLGTATEMTDLSTPLFSRKFGYAVSPVDEDAAEENEDGKPKRRMSIMGTFGYMAPEMVVLLAQSSSQRVGYSKAVDWWSLGVTMYKLLTGFRPFSEQNFQSFIDAVPSIGGAGVSFVDCPEYAMLFQEIHYPSYLSEEAIDVIGRLLDVNDRTRLGSGRQGFAHIKRHRFFHGIDWELLEQKHVVPPYLPELPPMPENAMSQDLHTMLRELGKGAWITDLPNPNEQKYFDVWDFTSTSTLKVEFGIASEMEQYDKNFKVRQLMGEKINTKIESSSTTRISAEGGLSSMARRFSRALSMA